MVTAAALFPRTANVASEPAGGRRSAQGCGGTLWAGQEAGVVGPREASGARQAAGPDGLFPIRAYYQ